MKMLMNLADVQLSVSAALSEGMLMLATGVAGDVVGRLSNTSVFSCKTGFMFDQVCPQVTFIYITNTAASFALTR